MRSGYKITSDSDMMDRLKLPAKALGDCRTLLIYWQTGQGSSEEHGPVGLFNTVTQPSEGGEMATAPGFPKGQQALK